MCEYTSPIVPLIINVPWTDVRHVLKVGVLVAFVVFILNNKGLTSLEFLLYRSFILSVLVYLIGCDQIVLRKSKNLSSWCIRSFIS